jgi:hypothetical protein
MTSGPSTAEFYRHEAARLRHMADSPNFDEVRHGLLRMAEEYERMAEQREGLNHHVFGQPFVRRPTDEAHAGLDAQQDNAEDRQRTG